MAAATTLGGSQMWAQTCNIAFGADKTDRAKSSYDGTTRLYNFCDRCVNGILGTTDVIDKVAKAAEAALMMVLATVESASAAVSNAYKHVKTFRSFIAITKGPVGLWRLCGEITKTVSLVGYLRAGAPEKPTDDKLLPGVSLNTGPFRAGSLNPKDEKTYADRVVGKTESRLALVCSALGIVSLATFTAGFGICKTSGFAASVGGAELRGRAKELPGSMGYVMFGNHISGVLGYFCGLPLRSMQKDRYIADLPDNDKKAAATDKVLNTYFSDTVISTLTCVKNGFELMNDVALFTPMTALYKAIAAVMIAFFDLLTTWVKTNK